MRVTSLLSALALIVAACSVFAANQPASPKSDRQPFSAQEIAQGYRSRAVIVKPRQGVDRASLDSAESAAGFTLVRSYPHVANMRALEIPQAMSLKQATDLLRASGRYDFVAKDRIHRMEAVPNDARFPEQWSLRNLGDTGGLANVDIKAVPAWDIQSSAADVIVAVVDSGARLTHNDLKDNLWVNTGEIAGNLIDDDNDGYIDDVHGINALKGKPNVAAGNPFDDRGHGSHVSGIIGAVGNNGIGISGVAWRVKIMPLKFIDSSGTGSTSDAIECFDYAIAKRVHIINASYGSESSTGEFNEAEAYAIWEARNAGIIVVVAAGNEGQNIDINLMFPAAYPFDNVIAVASSTALEDPADATSYGQGSCELFAPGESIVSLGIGSDDDYVVRSGTSMAAPHVAGALALIKAKFPHDSYRQLINRLLRGVDPVAKYLGKCHSGGRLNLEKALSTTSNRPFNDDFSERVRIVEANAFIRSSNIDARLEDGEPVHAGVESYGTVWWQWDAPASGVAYIDTAGSSFDTVLAVYTGNSLASLVPIASNDNYGTETYSAVSFDAVKGQSYQIAVSTRKALTGTVVVSIWTEPGNDSFANALVLSGPSVLVTADNTNATVETGEPRILGMQGGQSLWYRWTAPSAGTIQISAGSTAFDPTLAVYTGSSLSSLTLVASNDNGSATAATSSPLVTFQATAGTTYSICIDATTLGSYGPFVLNLTDSVWQYVTDSVITNAIAAAPDGTIYFGETGGTGLPPHFNALNPDGSLKWSYTLPSYGTDSSSAAVADDGTVVFPSMDGTCYALKSDGTLRWTYNIVEGASGSPAISTDGTVYVKGGDDALYAITLSTGALKWRYALGTTNTYAGPVIGNDGTVYVGGEDNGFHAVNPADGSRKWRFEADQNIYTSAAIDSSGNLYFATTAGSFYSLTSSGQQRWKRSLDASITSSPAIGDDGTVYFADYASKLHALKGEDGSSRWTFNLGSEVRASSPAIAADGTIFIGCYDKLIYAVRKDGTLARTYATGDWVRSSPLIVGTRLVIGSNDKKLYAFELGQGVSAGAWPMKNANGRRLGRADSSVVSFITHPQTQMILVGGTLELSASLSGIPLSYQWLKNGVVIEGATASSYKKTGVTAADAGSYTVSVTGAAGTIVSNAASITVEAPRRGRILGLAARGPSADGSAMLIIGFVLSGGTPGVQKPVILRGLGPALRDAGITDNIPNPMLQLYSGGALVDQNLDWGGTDALSDAFTRSYLSVPAKTSPEAALLRNFTQGAYAAFIRDEAGVEGVAMGEIYDFNLEPPGDPARATQSKLLGIAARARIAGGDRVLIGGFIIDGNVPLKILVRGIGPGMADALSDYVPNPKLEIFKNGQRILSNDDWSGDALVLQAASSLGMTFPSTSSKDAAILATLAPGVYTAVVSGADANPGVALVEIYEIEN